MRDEALNCKKDNYRNMLDTAMEEGKFDDALSAALMHESMQIRSLSRIAHNLKNKIADDLAKRINDYVSTFKGFGLNLNMLFATAQSGCGMLGLVAGLKLGPFHDFKIELKDTMEIAQRVQSIFGNVKGLTDEGNQWHRTMTQSHVDNTKRQQEENKNNLQRLQSSLSEIQHQAKTHEESRHRAKMNSAGG